MKKRGGILINLVAVFAILSLLALAAVQTLELMRYLGTSTPKTEPASKPAES